MNHVFGNGEAQPLGDGKPLNFSKPKMKQKFKIKKYAADRFIETIKSNVHLTYRRSTHSQAKNIVSFVVHGTGSQLECFVKMWNAIKPKEFNRKIAVELTVEQIAEIMRNAVVADAKFKTNGMDQSTSLNNFSEQISGKVTEEEGDYIIGVVKEVDGEIVLTTKN